MGNSHSKADRSCEQVLDEGPPSSQMESSHYATSPQSPRLYTGVLLEGISTPSYQSDVAKRKAEHMFEDLGLGRGIDATRVKPWLNRTSAQVRPVRFDDLIGTDEGSSYAVYKEVSLSSNSLHLKMHGEIAVPASLGAPAPSSPTVEIGVDSDYTRTIITEQRVIGRRVINRTIGFRDNIHDLPFHPQSSSPSRSSSASRKTIFEQEVFKWICQRYPDLGTMVVNLTDLFHLLVSEEQFTADVLLNEFKSLCKQFTQYFHVTHYVSAITLGAAEYETMTENEYQKEMKLSGNVGLDRFVTSRMGVSKSSRQARSMYNYWTIGKIMGEGKSAHVPHSAEKEAVIKVDIKPIYHLVRDPLLGNILRTAVQEYISEQKDRRLGRFYIASETSITLHEAVTVYLKLDVNYQLSATTVKAEAMAFAIIPAGSTRKNEFHIVYEEDEKVKPLGQYYLCTPLTAGGTSPSRSPPHFQLHSQRKDCLFALHSPLHNKGDPAEDLDPWLYGQRGYFIHCTGQRFRSGYLGVWRKGEGQNVQYVPTCSSSRNTGQHHSMIFKLLPASMPFMYNQP